MHRLPRLFGISLILSIPISVASNAEEPSFKTVEAKRHFEKAIEPGDQHQWRAALLELNRALEYEPENVAVLIELGTAYGEIGQWRASLLSLF